MPTRHRLFTFYSAMTNTDPGTSPPRLLVPMSNDKGLASLFAQRADTMASDPISNAPVSGGFTKDINIMSKETDSPSSTPPATTTHIETGHTHLHHRHPQEYRHSTVEGQVPYAEHGALVDHKIPQEELVQSEPDLAWSRIRHYMREPFSEFFGVFILILFGDGVVAQVVLSGLVKGDYQSISWGWG